MSNNIHPTAVIDPGVKLGDGITVGPYAVIEDNCQIGDGCIIHPHVKIARYTTIGPRTVIYLGALVGEEPQDHRWKAGILSSTEIGSDCVIREYVTIHRSPFEGGKTIIGNHTLLMGFVHVGHDCDIGNYVTIANNTAVSGHVIIDDGAVLSGYVLVHQFSRIGALAMVGPGTKIRQDVAPFCMINDDAYTCGINVVGLRRAGFDGARRLAVRRAVKTYFFKGLNGTKALEEIEKDKEHYTADVQKFVEFIRASERGMIPGDPDMVGRGGEEE